MREVARVEADVWGGGLEVCGGGVEGAEDVCRVGDEGG